MRTVEKSYILFAPPEIDIYGTEHPTQLGTVKCAVCRLTGEEIADCDLERTRQRYTGCVRLERSPIGGFVRGMRLVSDGVSYNVLSAVLCGRVWLLSLDRVLAEGERADA